ncbi:alanine racemase [Deinococcus roseus]|uniref:Alanine racemase n=1 Tax=Deinococcus roseus TaxID=392414 RepID=A0ABQ2DC59_9DEIO|nr:alanine racemase [Deinococcus roseus]GGJ52033.1 alanine racemase [Deinococcus roseus]
MRPSIVAWIDPEALLHNLQVIHGHAGQKPVMAVLKANAYGHGLSLVAPLLDPRPEIWGFAVSTGQEAQQIRQSGSQKPILLLAPPDPRDLPELHRVWVRFTVSSLEELQDLPAGAGVHLKINTGLNRLGVRPENLAALLAEVQARNLRLEGCYAHFAFADQPDLVQARRELEVFRRVCTLLPEGLIRHMGASEGLLALGEDAAFDVVRPGLALLGNVGATHLRGVLPLKPVMTVQARVCFVHTVQPGETVSYGGFWRAERPTRVAVLQVGYADGYPIRAAGKARVFAKGEHRPTLGLFGMDQILFDATDLNVQVGDWVEVLNPTTLTADVLSDWGETISSQLLSCLGARVERRLREFAVGQQHNRED